MTPNQKSILEKFLQYGDLVHANLIFMGYEEGVAKLPPPHDVEICVKARELLHNNLIYKNCRIYVNGFNDRHGWYINNALWTLPGTPLTHATNDAIKILGYTFAWNPPTVNVINMQTRLYWLLQGNNRTVNYTVHNKTAYNKNGYNPNIGRHMIDFYPFPKRSKKSWDNVLNINGINNLNSYYSYYNNYNNNRTQILTNLYNNLSMDYTVSYLGKNKGNFLGLNFYRTLGFGNFQLHNTGQIHNNYRAYIKPSNKPKEFLLGQRIRQKDKNLQKVVLTPFFGNGAFGYDDIDALSTWL